MFKGATLKLSANIQAIQTTSESFNSNQLIASKASEWLINKNFYIKLYKYNNSTNTWDFISSQEMAPKSVGGFGTSNWSDVINPYQSASMGVARFKIMNNYLSLRQSNRITFHHLLSHLVDKRIHRLKDTAHHHDVTHILKVRVQVIIPILAEGT